MKTTGRRVEKPWGFELIWAETPKYLGKILHINYGQQLSLQYHNLKEETIRVIAGTLELQIHHSGADGAEGGVEKIKLEVGEGYHITPKTIHRMRAEYGDVEILEVSTGELLDVVRLEDSYGRKGT